jgi:diaminopimelate epimerase
MVYHVSLSAVCGGQKDTVVIQDQKIGSIKASALGRTLVPGPVDPERVIVNFMTPHTETRIHTRHFPQDLH